MANLEDITRAIAEREAELREKLSAEKIIGRQHEDMAKKLLSTDVALVITGVRRCGKSILAFSLGSGNCGYVNFEDERLEMKASELNKVLEAIYALKGDCNFFVFDEIQNIRGWEKFVSRLVPAHKIIVTGSNARLLSKEFATALTGRHLTFTLFPFSFREFLLYRDFKPDVHLTKDVARIKKHLDEYLELGGFPLAYKVGKLFLSELYSDVIERDVIQRYGIRYQTLLKDIAKYLVSNFATEISHNKIRKIFGVKSAHTVNKYIGCLKNSFLLFEIQRFSPKLKESLKAPKKIYCIDTGMAQQVSANASKRAGALMENLVAIELQRRKSYSDVKLDVFYWKDYQQAEVDFVVREEDRTKELIQVTYASEKNEVPEREVRSLIKAGQALKCRNLLVVTWDFEGEEKTGRTTVRYVPLWKWLLEQ
ncbi:TPA: ATP-binding protein [Candidatus Micrarchaeota archaeon]|nr:ATP-binding protein [Candidatus Micrarchaeota archaeon]